jgi:metal-responsive CopG/Arc/MetJ family transcriptional regulator
MARKFIGERVHVHLPPDMIERIAAIVPGNGRAKFIREAVQAELDRRDAGADSASVSLDTAQARSVDPAALYAALAARKASRQDQ